MIGFMSAVRAVGEVFTPGRMPEVTYNPRDNEDLEGNIRRYLENRGAAMTVSGPTKSGKTVVVERLLPRDQAIWVTGGDLTSLDSLWDRVVEFLNLYDQVQVKTVQGLSAGGSASINLGLPGSSVSFGGSGGATSGSEATLGAKRPLAAVARDALREWSVPVVIDDFHYVPESLKLSLIRAIKGLIMDSPVVLIAVPQDAFRVVREETDMLGRIWQLEIKPWSRDELIFIARAGFRALNLNDPGDVLATEFAENSLGAPFLMQQLCLDYCLSRGIREVSTVEATVEVPSDRQGFYQDVATRYVPGVFDLLKRGPRTKGQPRLARKLKDGQQTDIYGAVLFGISRMGAVREIPTQSLARIIAEYFVDAPTTQNVAFALGQLKTIALDHRGASDPALAYKDDVLFMADPFLSFYLRYGRWDLPSPPMGAI